MNRLEKAILIATQAHAGQVDKGGNPYILHPLRIMLRMSTEDTMIAAVLHDVLEDTNVTAEDLLSAGLSREVVAGDVLNSSECHYAVHSLYISMETVARRMDYSN